MIKFITEFIDYIAFGIGGLVGAVVHRIRNKMSFKQFLGVLFISAFIGVCVGVGASNYLDMPDEVIYVVCSISGVFSKDILDEIQEILKLISDYVKNKMQK